MFMKYVDTVLDIGIDASLHENDAFRLWPAAKVSFIDVVAFTGR